MRYRMFYGIELYGNVGVVTQYGCEHRGTIWRVVIIGGQADPTAPEWECTRCGQRWHRLPESLRSRVAHVPW